MNRMISWHLIILKMNYNPGQYIKFSYAYFVSNKTSSEITYVGIKVEMHHSGWEQSGNLVESRVRAVPMAS